MKSFLPLLATLFYGFGALAIYSSVSDIQIILAVLCFGFGSIILALSTILNMIRNALEGAK